MRALAVAFLLAVIPSSLTEATPCLPGSLQSYIDLGSGGCSIEDKTVFGFLDLGILGGAIPILPSDVAVTPIETPGEPGLTFDFGVSAGPGEFFQALFAFSVAVDPGGMPIGAVSLSLGGSAVDPDGANSALLCIGTLDPACPTPDTVILFDIGVDSLLSDSRAFAPLAALDLVADIVVDAGLSGSATLSSATLRFQEIRVVPEPVLSIPLAAGLLALTRIRRRGKR